MTKLPVRILAGPQNPVRNIGELVAASRIPEGPIAVISAGWQEAEGDLDELQSVVGRPLEDLGLNARTEWALREDTGLRDAYRVRQDLLQDLQQLYRIRLRSLSMAARRLYRIEGDSDLLQTERSDAVRQLRALDEHHVDHTEAIQADFAASVDPGSREPVLQCREKMTEILNRSVGVIVTGGNVAVITNRLRLFGFGDLLRDRHLFAWSAGAMALSHRIVLFHQRMPQGKRDPEIFGRGLGLLGDVVVLPDTEHRLNSDERVRMQMMARRFAPDVCVALDNESAVHLNGDRLVQSDGARTISKRGRLERLRIS